MEFLYRTTSFGCAHNGEKYNSWLLAHVYIVREIMFIWASGAGCAVYGMGSYFIEFYKSLLKTIIYLLDMCETVYGLKKENGLWRSKKVVSKVVSIGLLYGHTF